MKLKPVLLAVIATVFFSCGGHNSTKEEEKATGGTAATDIPVNPLKNCYFGDLHLHTALSADANFFGATLLPEDSYKFAMGEEVEYMGQKVKRIAPLDFLAVTDHSEYLGAIAAVRDPNGPFAGTELYRQYTSKDQKDVAKSFGGFCADMSANKPNPELNRPR
jgi:hypothetical protein